jgi:two-component system sensor histidine kinase/response regulator
VSSSPLVALIGEPEIGTQSGEHALAVSASTAAVPPGVRVLVADDDPLIRRALVKNLTRIGFEVHPADDGAPAIALAETTPPDIAVVDLTMPTSGLEVVRRLKELYGSAVHVTVLSGRDDEETRMTAFDAGADDFLVKPIPIAELRRRIAASARSQQAYVQARQARDRADRLLAYSAEASALLAHDLNNGLAVALSNMTYLAQTVTLDEDQDQALGSTLRALKRMAGLVANFVDIARFEDAQVKPRATRIAIRELLLEVMSVHAPSIGKGIRHSVTCDPELFGFFDEALIERVLHNLVGNAVRYCNPGGLIKLAAEPWLQPERQAGVELQVINTGPTIPDAMRGTLFAKYARGNNGKRGLGLYFCRLACDAHGGSIGYEATAEGSLFVIRIPGPTE